MNINDISMQKFVSQPRGDGYYEVAKWDEVKKEYIPLPKVVYKMEQKAQERARQLNEENKEQEKQQKKERNEENRKTINV